MKRKRLAIVLGCALALAILAGIAIPITSMADEVITFLNPLGKVEPLKNLPLASRLDSLSGKAILPLYDANTGGQQAVAAMTGRLQAAPYSATIRTAVSLGATNTVATFGPKTAAQYDTWAATCDAVLIGVVNENVSAWWAAYHAKQMEARGKPVVVVVNEPHVAALVAGAQDNGFAALRYVKVNEADYAKAFVQGTTATTVQTYMSNNIFTTTFVVDVAASLTTAPTEKELDPAPLPASKFGYIDGNTFTVTGATYAKAVQAFYDMSMAYGFGDGLPLVIPTRDLVDAMLAATNRAGDEVLGKIKLRGGIVTVEKVATNAVMAGARPEHFNAILAAMEAYVSAWEDGKTWYHAMSSSENNLIVFLLSGPITAELDVMRGRSYGHSGNEPAAVIGHAVKLCIRNIGHVTNATSAPRYDRANDHALYCFGENYEETRALGWSTLSEDLTFGANANTITMVACNWNRAYSAVGAEFAVQSSSLVTSHRTHIGSTGSYRPAIAVLNPSAAKVMMKANNELIYTGVNGGGYANKLAVRRAITAATPNDSLLQFSQVIIAGKDPTNGRNINGEAFYGNTAFQTQLISGSITAPSAPRNFKATVSADGTEVAMEWDPPARIGGGSITRYEVSIDDGVTWRSAGLATEYTFTGMSLESDSQCFFRARAVNDIFNAANITGAGTTASPGIVDKKASGRGAWATAEIIFEEPVAAPAAPSAPAAMPGDAEVALSWAAVTDADSYNVYYRTAVGSYGAAIPVAGTSYTVVGLTNGTAYYFAVSAVNSAGESAKSAETAATPQAPITIPAVPSAPAAMPGDAEVALSWAAVTGADSYNVYYRTAVGSYGAAIPVAGTSYTVAGLTNGTAYYFAVSAVNSAGESAKSAETAATPQATAVNVPLTGIRIDSIAMVTLTRNSTCQMSVVLTPANPTTVAVVWSVSDTTIASVDSSGRVTAKNKTGTVTLTARDTVSGLSSTIVLRIT